MRQADDAANLDQRRQAVITTAARAAVGRLVVMPGMKTSMTAMASGADDARQLRFAPADSATGVRELLLLTGKPWDKPVAMLAAPRATSSWLGSRRLPAAPGHRPREDAGVGHRDEGDGGGAGNDRSMSPSGNDGRLERRQPLGRAPTVAMLHSTRGR